MENTKLFTAEKMEEIIVQTITLTLKSNLSKEWFTISEATKYIGISHNTFVKFRKMGLKVCHVDGVKRVSRKEIDEFLEKYSY